MFKANFHFVNEITDFEYEFKTKKEAIAKVKSMTTNEVKDFVWWKSEDTGKHLCFVEVVSYDLPDDYPDEFAFYLWTREEIEPQIPGGELVDEEVVTV